MMRVLREAGVVVAATIGAGVFALPYVFSTAGFWVSVLYIAVLSVIVIFVHRVYWQMLDAVGERERLLGLAKRHLGGIGYVLGFATIVLGLLLVLVVYLILGSRFIVALLPSWSEQPALLVFWFVCAAPLLFKEKKALFLENIGAILTAILMASIFLLGGLPRTLPPTASRFNDLFLPFGALLFSLAGWTAIEPLYGMRRETRGGSSWNVSLPLGTIIAAILYIVFVLGILSLAPRVLPDTISSFAGDFLWIKLLLAVFGAVAVWKSYGLIMLEIKNALTEDLRWPKSFVVPAVIFLPLLLVFAGVNNFLKVIGLAGGLFASLEYLLIIFVARRALRLPRLQGLAVHLAALVFILGAVYEIYYFVVEPILKINT